MTVNLQTISTYSFPIESQSAQVSSPGQIPVSTNISLGQRVKNAYTRAIIALVEFLNRHKWYTTGMVLGTLLIEP